MLRKLDRKIVINRDVWTAPNLCDRFTEDDLDTLGGWVWQGYERDDMSRMKWKKRTSAAMDLAMQIQQDKNFPWPGCANVVFPLVTIASLQFSCRSYPNLISGSDVVKYRTIGKDPEQKLRDRADRIGRHMSWQVLEEDSSWEEQHDRLLINLGIVGCNFIKTFYSPGLRHSVSELVMARDFVLDYYAKSVEECARKTQVIKMYRNDIYEKMVSGLYRDQLDEEWFNNPAPMAMDETQADVDKRTGKTPPDPDEDSPYLMLEQHRNLDLDQDGYAEPYIVTLEQNSKKVVKLVSRWEREEDIDKTDFPGMKSRIKRIKSTEYFTKYGFIPSPDGGVYDLGFGTLLGPINEAVSTGINQILDAGTMDNSNGGFLGRGVKIRGGVYTMAPWVWKRVDSTGDDLRKNMVPFPKSGGNSSVMFSMIGLLVEYANRISGATDPMVGENPGQNTPAETSRNMTEQGMQVYKGIFKRVWRSMKEEFKKRHQLNALYLQSRKSFGNDNAWVTQEDYRSDPDLIVPAADPNIVSDGMRLTQANLLVQASHTRPGYSQEAAEKNWLRAIKIDAIEHFYPGPDKTPPIPNPKMQVEQAKLQAVQMKLQFDKWKFTQELMSQQKKTQAEIVKLYAEVNMLLAQAQTEKVKAKVEAFSAMVEALETHNSMLNANIETQMKQAEGAKDDEGGMGGMAGASGDGGGIPSLPAPSQGGGAPAMGGGGVPA